MMMVMIILGVMRIIRMMMIRIMARGMMMMGVMTMVIIMVRVRRMRRIRMTFLYDGNDDDVLLRMGTGRMMMMIVYMTM